MGLRCFRNCCALKTWATGSAAGRTVGLRRQMHVSRARFMDCIATGSGVAAAAEEYTNAVRQYRIAMFADIMVLDNRSDAPRSGR